MDRQHTHVPVFTLVIVSLLIGLSISGGPVVWAVIVMLSPLAVLYAIARSAHHSPH